MPTGCQRFARAHFRKKGCVSGTWQERARITVGKIEARGLVGTLQIFWRDDCDALSEEEQFLTLSRKQSKKPG